MATMGTQVIRAQGNAQHSANKLGEPFAVVVYAGSIIVMPARRVPSYLLSHPAGMASDYYYPEEL